MYRSWQLYSSALVTLIKMTEIDADFAYGQRLVIEKRTVIGSEGGWWVEAQNYILAVKCFVIGQ